MSFYRGGWCPYCNLELRALHAALPEICALGAELIAISPEQPDKSLSTIEKNALGFDVLSDSGNRVARDYGLVFALAEELRPIYASFGSTCRRIMGTRATSCRSRPRSSSRRAASSRSPSQTPTIRGASRRKRSSRRSERCRADGDEAVRA